jgi:cell division protein ZapE
LKKNIDVLYLDSPTDYRLKNLSEDHIDLNDLYFTPAGSVALSKMSLIYQNMIKSNARLSKGFSITLPGREWLLEKAVEGQACIVSFAECCEQPRAAEDYIALADAFPVLFINDVPKMGYDRRNEAKRFILLIDTLYDRGNALVMSAEAEPDKLYYGDHHAFEFQRTISRLQEMRYKALTLGD